MLYDRILKESKKIGDRIEVIQEKLKTFPKNKLICTRNGKNCKWYQSDGHVTTYIPKKERHLAEQLAIKKYLSCELEELLSEQKSLNYYLKSHSKKAGKAEKLLTESFGYSELLSSYFQPRSQELQEWMNASYERYNNYPEQLIHKTSSGNVVRSKSEAMIDLYLYTNNIPFRYECALRLGNVTIYPDFTIRHPQTGEIYYWEHFGMIDEPEYSKNVGARVQRYIQNGIYPSIHLITTYETKDNPLSSEVIEKIVEHYFLQ